MKSLFQGRAMMVTAAALLGLGLVLLVAMRKGGAGPGREKEMVMQEGATGRGGKSVRSRESRGEQEAEWAEMRRAREALRDDPRLKEIWEEDGLVSSWMSDVLKPFNAKELRRLLKDPHANEWELSGLIMRAAAEKRPEFQDVLERPDFQGKPHLEMAACAYDYSVNGNREALEQILACHHAAGASGDDHWGSPAARALQCVDEWDLAKRALGAHPLGPGEADGPGDYGFWLTRRYLFPKSRDFPEDYERFVEDLGGKKPE